MKPLVIYIIGDNRSGTTLLDYLLSNHPKAVSVGELHHLNRYVYKGTTDESTDLKCSCGKYVETCSFWKDILKDVQFNKDFVTLYDKQGPKWLFSLPFLYKSYLNKLLNNKKTYNKGKEIAKNRWKLYHSIMRKSNKPIVIDSSKFAVEAFFLQKFNEGEIRFLHLERNIWEVALSKVRRKNPHPTK